MSRFYTLSKHRFAVVLTVFLSLPFLATAQQGMRVGSSAAPSEMLHVEGAILLGTTSNTNAGTIRWNGTDFQGYNGSAWVSLNSAGALYTAGTGLSLAANAFSLVPHTGDVTGTTVLTIANNAVTIAKLPAGATGTTFLRGDGTWVVPPTATYTAGTGITIAGTTISHTSHTGDVTGADALTIAANAVTNTKLADMAASTMKGRITSTGDPQDLDQSQVLTLLGLTNAITGTGTANKVAFFTGANTIDDNTNFHWDNTNARLGIGNTAPDYQFDVKGVGIDAGPGAFDNILGRFEQSDPARGAGIQIKGYRNTSGNITSFVDLRNQSATNYSVARMAALREAGEAGSLLLYTNSGTALTERLRITSAGVVQLNAYTTNGIVRATGGNGTLSTAGGGVNLASEITGVLPVANGGTGSATQNFVDLTTAQTAAGVKTWSNNAFFNGNVSIGTTNTGYTLDVDGNGHFNAGLKVDGLYGTDVCPGGCSFAQYTNCCPAGSQTGFRNMGLWVSEGVRAREFYTESDERIKDVIGISNAKNDLDKIMAIEITEYTFIDKSKGHSTMKKVIAQQVEKVYPEAVTKSISIVPDIYQLSTINGGFIPLKTNVVKGDNVKLIYDDNAVVLAEVTSVVEDGFYVNQDRTGQVFIYGREVNDFRIVDYDALAMLNISATQALFKRVNELEKLGETLQVENATLKADVSQLKSMSEDIELLKEAVGIDKRAQK